MLGIVAHYLTRTNSDIDEVVFIEFPGGFSLPGLCLLLEKALYGLTRSPLLWQQDFSAQLVKWGFKPVKEEPCLFINGPLLIFFYVDDIAALCHTSELSLLYEFQQQLTERYEMRDLGESSWFLGIRIHRDRAKHKLWLCQDSYFEKVADLYGLADRPTASTPLVTTPLPQCEEDASSANLQHTFAQRLGSLMYGICATRPDLAFTQSYLGRFCKNPPQVYIDAAERALAYAYQTRYLALEYSAPEKPETETCTVWTASSDASFADKKLIWEL